MEPSLQTICPRGLLHHTAVANKDKPVKSRNYLFSVVSTKARIHYYQTVIDSLRRGHDMPGDFSRNDQ